MPLQVLEREEWCRDKDVWAGLIEGDRLGTGISLLFEAAADAGEGPPMHVHPYDEIHIVRSGQVRYVGDGTDMIVGPGDIVVVPAGTPHRLETLGAAEALSVHLAPKMAMEIVGNN